MMGNFLMLIILILFSCSSGEYPHGNSPPPAHHLWDSLLQEHVSPEGLVHYPGLIEQGERLQRYLALLSTSPPNPATWSEEEQLAYWINAYNAFAIKLILDHYPVQSIQDLHPRFKIPGLRTVWHKRFFKIGGKPMSLDQIEHKILRRDYNEPRIHFAINCASISCPPLRNQAFTAENLDQQLDEQARQFINDANRNQITSSDIVISRIFRWFKGDFTEHGSLIDFLNTYSNKEIDTNASISYMPYDWNLNSQTP